MRTLLLSLAVTWLLTPTLACQDAATPRPEQDAAGQVVETPQPGQETDEQEEERGAPQPQPGDPTGPLVEHQEFEELEHVPTEEEFFDGLVAPLALAPDMLLTPVLGALSDPEALTQAAATMAAHPEDQPPPRMPSGHLAVLAHVPEVLTVMADNPDWMDLMKQAMTHRRAKVMAAIQRVRRGAMEVGNLQTDDVIKVTDTGDRIKIEPADKAVLRVPRYDGAQVYVEPLTTDLPLLEYGPPITFPGYKTARAGLLAVDSVATMANTPAKPLPMGDGGTGRGTRYVRSNGRRAFITGMVISRNRRHHRNDPVRRIGNLMVANSFFY